MKRRPRFVLATPICDGHDAAIVAITRMLREEGVEAVYIGFNKTPRQIVKAAVEEDASAIAISSYNGGHMTFLKQVLEERKRQGVGAIPVFCGGGGTILAREVAPLQKMGVAKVYRPPLDLRQAVLDMIAETDKRARAAGRNGASANGFVRIARKLTSIESNGAPRRAAKKTKAPAKPKVWGIGGRGGAGKSTIVDELIYRHLRAAKGKIAVLCIDPTLGDRLRMLHCYSPRVYLRSVRLMAGESLERRLPPMIDALRAEDFDLVLVESVGLGQIDLGVAPYVDASIYCMTPEYGTDVQLEKEALLRRARVVVMNKRDYPQAETKARRIRRQLKDDQNFFATEAKCHGDPGVTSLYLKIAELSGIDADADALAMACDDIEPAIPASRRGYLGAIVDAQEAYYKEMEREAAAAARDPKKARPHLDTFKEIWGLYGYRGADDARNGRTRQTDDVLYRSAPDGADIPIARKTTCDLWVPVLGLPAEDSSPLEVVRYLYKQNAPGRFPFTEGTFANRRADQDPIRMFAGLGLPETTNARFHLLRSKGGAPRLSTAFDSLTLYGLDSDEEGALAKVGEGGVAVDSVDDMKRLYAGFDLEKTSVSMTMSGPAPTVLAMYFAAARQRRFDLKKLRGTIQTDILKEIQAQNEAVFPLDPSLRLIADMMEWRLVEAPLWYPISISGYHIHEAGANAVMELAFTLANGFTYVELMRKRGVPIEEVVRRFSFFFTAGSELEFNVYGRVARRVWAIAMKRCYGIEGPAQRLKFHTQTSGRSLQDTEPLHNLARVTLQAQHGLDNNTNSLHTNSYKETYTTPEIDDVMLAMGCQQIPLLESGDYRFIENLHQGAWGLERLEDEVERAVWRIFREIDQQGGVIPAIENEYFRTMIQDEVQKEQKARRDGKRTLIGVNYLTSDGEKPRGELVNIPLAEKNKQIARTRAFKKKHERKADAALRRLQEVALGDGNVFAELVEAAQVATVGQITHALWDVWGKFRASM